jgi:hypothetical protein
MIQHPKVYPNDDPQIQELLRDPRVRYLLRQQWEAAIAVVDDHGCAGECLCEFTIVVCGAIAEELEAACMKRYPINDE